MTLKSEYPVVLRPLGTDDGGGWVAFVADLPGCMSDGESANDALENIQGAIEEWNEMARELGRSIPNPDDFLQSRFEDSDPEHIRQQAEFIAKQMLAGQPDTVDQSAVHAIIAEWARGAGHRMRL